MIALKFKLICQLYKLQNKLQRHAYWKCFPPTPTLRGCLFVCLWVNEPPHLSGQHVIRVRLTLKQPFIHWHKTTLQRTLYRLCVFGIFVRDITESARRTCSLIDHHKKRVWLAWIARFESLHRLDDTKSHANVFVSAVVTRDVIEKEIYEFLRLSRCFTVWLSTASRRAGHNRDKCLLLQGTRVG